MKVKITMTIQKIVERSNLISDSHINRLKDSFKRKMGYEVKSFSQLEVK